VELEEPMGPTPWLPPATEDGVLPDSPVEEGTRPTDEGDLSTLGPDGAAPEDAAEGTGQTSDEGAPEEEGVGGPAEMADEEPGTEAAAEPAVVPEEGVEGEEGIEEVPPEEEQGDGAQGQETLRERAEELQRQRDELARTSELARENAERIAAVEQQLLEVQELGREIEENRQLRGERYRRSDELLRAAELELSYGTAEVASVLDEAESLMTANAVDAQRWGGAEEYGRAEEALVALQDARVALSQSSLYFARVELAKAIRWSELASVAAESYAQPLFDEPAFEFASE